MNFLGMLAAAFLLSATIACGADPSAETAGVWRLPMFTQASTWRAEPADQEHFRVRSIADALAVDFDCTQGNAAELRLVQPVPVPAAAPTPPLEVVGLRFVGQHQRESTSTSLFLRDFALTALDSRTSQRYYQFRGRECSGEIEPLPSLTPLHLQKFYGKRFDISWELRDRYEGTPFLVGGERFEFESAGEPVAVSEKAGRLPDALESAKRITFPVTERGTYWARVRLRWSASGKDPVPDEISEQDFRLDVVSGDEPIVRSPVAANVMPAQCFIRIAPDRESLIYRPDESFVIRVAFADPGAAIGGATYLVRVRRAADNVEMKVEEVAPTWPARDPFMASVDLTALPADTYIVAAEILVAGKPFDRVERLVARQPKFDAAASDTIPPSVPSARDLLGRPEPLFHLGPMLPDDAAAAVRGEKAWEEQCRPFLDAAAQLSSRVELNIPWKTVEPLPGVFDWGIVDRVVAYAAEKKLKVQLSPSFRTPPEWLPGAFEQSEDGRVFGMKQPYLFHGGRPNFVHAPEIHDRVVDFVRTVTRRYRGHPAVEGYYLLFEHPGDTPVSGWYEGYAPASIAAFRSAARGKYGAIEATNRRWGTSYSSWDSVVPPSGAATSRYRLDWLQFKARGIDGFLQDCVMAIRSVDDRRLITIYADGIHDLEWFAKQGCMTANGGSHDAMWLADYAAYALAGLPQRTEDHSPSNWTAYFPSQLDASVFAMMAGGGVNAHCKAFVATKNRFGDVADPDVSLGRYRRFLPIWRELRGTELAQPIEAFLLKDLGGYMLEANATHIGSWNDSWAFLSLSQAHVPVAAGFGDLWSKGKLVIAREHLREVWATLVDKIVAYVEQGGTLLMAADAARTCVDAPNEDWVLLQRFGIAPPTTERTNRLLPANPAPGPIFSDESRSFTLRDVWKIAPPAGMQTEAFFGSGRSDAALSWKQFGKGRVAVLWAHTIVPPLFSPSEAAYPFFRDVANWAGIRPMADATDDRLWTNLLKTPDEKAWYGLAHVGSWQNTPTTGVDCRVRWLVLPPGEYAVTELTTGRELGSIAADQLRTEGLPVKLAPKEIAIFRMVRKP
jgi:hypothetical protein